jgi:uncharacterized protein YegP (UPF0339 family)
MTTCFGLLKAANNEVIPTSGLYKTRASAGNGIASVKINGASQTVKDIT